MNIKKNKYCTLQIIPHGKGQLRNFTIRIVPIVSMFILLVLILLASLGSTYFLWNETRHLNDRIKTILTYKSENEQLKVQVAELNHELLDLHQEVGEMRDWLEDIQNLGQDIRELEDAEASRITTDETLASRTTRDDTEDLRTNMNEPEALSTSLNESAKLMTYRIASLGHTEIEPTTQSLTITELRSQIDLLKEETLKEEEELIHLKEELEEKRYLAQFIPSIRPSNGRITSKFGWRKDPFHGRRTFHEGIDFASYYKSPIYSGAQGTVVFVGRNGGHGNHIRINHGNGFVTTYSHLASYNVEEGDQVNKGDLIGRMGSTGRSTGVHLHYEIHKNGQVVNPANYINGTHEKE